MFESLFVYGIVGLIITFYIILVEYKNELVQAVSMAGLVLLSLLFWPVIVYREIKNLHNEKLEDEEWYAKRARKTGRDVVDK